MKSRISQCWFDIRLEVAYRHDEEYRHNIRSPIQMYRISGYSIYRDLKSKI